jgi:ATP-binding protein involved in chromosome partitioning
MSDVTQEAVRAALAKVEDPALNRPITRGQLGEVVVSKDAIRIAVSLISPGFPLKAQLDADIRNALAEFGLAVDIEYGLEVPRKPPRQDLNRLPTVKNIIAVAAGKGGVGKSTVSVNLALSLQAMGAKVGILDADIYGPSIPHMMGTPARQADKSTAGDRILPAIHRGLPVMSVDFFVEEGRAVIWRGPMIHKLLQQFLEDVEWGPLDYLIVDLPPGTGDAQLSLGQLIPITACIIVTTPQEVALLDVRKAVDMFDKLDVPVVGVIENMSHYTCPACGHHDKIFAAGGGKRLAEEIGVELLGQLPIEHSVAHGGETGLPVVVSAPQGELAQTFASTGARVAMEASKISGTGPKRSSMLRTVS